MPIPNLCDWSLSTECIVVGVIDIAYRSTATLAPYIEENEPFMARYLYSPTMILYYLGVISTLIMIYYGAVKKSRPCLWQFIIVSSIRLIFIVIGYGYIRVILDWAYEEGKTDAWTNTAFYIADLVPCYNNFWFCAIVPALCMGRVYNYIRKLRNDENRLNDNRSPIIVYKQDFVPAPQV